VRESRAVRRHLNYRSETSRALAAFISYFNKAPPSFRDKQHYACMRARAVAERKWFYNIHKIERVPSALERRKVPIQLGAWPVRRFLFMLGVHMRERKSVRKGLQAERHVFFFSEWFLVSYPGREGYAPSSWIKRVKYSVAASCLLNFSSICAISTRPLK